MRIYIDPYLLDMPQVRSIDRSICDGTEFCVREAKEPEDAEAWTLAWGYPPTKRRFGAAETGFFWDAMHIDTLGLYQFSSLNSAWGRDEIEAFSAPQSAADLIRQSPFPNSKYRQKGDAVEWSGVVFACQNPTDRSVQTVASTADWWRFYEDCCRFYGATLFVKLHPWNRDATEDRIRETASRHGCTVDRVGHSILKCCEHVVLFSSSFSVDCILHGVPVKQAAPGYFWQTGAVSYCAFSPRRKLHDTTNAARQLLDFLVWRYCFSMDCSHNDWRHLLRLFAHSTELFPLPTELSYGSYLVSKLPNSQPAL